MFSAWPICLPIKKIVSIKFSADKTSTSSLVSGRISSLIQEAESKTPKKKSSENLNLIRRESPIGSENSETGNKSKMSGGSIGSTGSSNNILAESASAPKLPPKPGQSIILLVLF